MLSSALAVAFVSHVCRQKYDQLTALEREKNQLQVAYGKYLLEQSAWGSLQRIETMAKDRSEYARSAAPRNNDGEAITVAKKTVKHVIRAGVTIW